jgi:SAM-dependent methyltransferase
MVAKLVSTPHDRETDSAALEVALQRIVQRRILARGEIDFPCVPALRPFFLEQLLQTWSALGKAFSDDERGSLDTALGMALDTGFEATPYARMVVGYEVQAPPVGVEYAIRLKENTIEQHYEHWLSERKPPLFGMSPDAKAMDLARTLGAAASARVLDIGAGTGRNALPLARSGHPVDAVELVPALADELKKAREEEGLPVDVIVGDVLSTDFSPNGGRYKLALLSEVAPHFRAVTELETVFEKFAHALLPGGIALVNLFLAADGYQPDAVAEQVAEVSWSRIFTRRELAFITERLPFDCIDEDSVHDHQRKTMPADAWPPTTWFVDWSRGRNVFDLPLGRAPIDLRWFAYRRR